MRAAFQTFAVAKCAQEPARLTIARRPFNLVARAVNFSVRTATRKGTMTPLLAALVTVFLGTLSVAAQTPVPANDCLRPVRPS